MTVMSIVQAQILPISARKGNEQVGRTLLFDKCQTTGVEGQVVHGFDPHHKSEKTLFKNTF